MAATVAPPQRAVPAQLQPTWRSSALPGGRNGGSGAVAGDGPEGFVSFVTDDGCFACRCDLTNELRTQTDTRQLELGLKRIWTWFLNSNDQGAPGPGRVWFAASAPAARVRKLAGFSTFFLNFSELNLFCEFLTVKNQYI